MSEQANPALLQWIDEQLARGCDPREMIEAMVTVGHARPFAQALVARASGQAGLARPAAPVEAVTDDEPNEVPEPLSVSLAAGANALDLGDHQVDVLVNFVSPRIIVFGGLLTDDECDALVEASRHQLERSETVDRASGGTQLNAARTSEGTYFFHGASPLVETIDRRLARATRWPLSNGEPLQILHYGVGAEYQPHYDYFSPEDAGTPKLLEHGGQRVATLICYLNTPAAGGATVFPDIGLEVAAKKGNAVFFAYDRPTPSSRTLHGGTPVVAGEKWIATRWMRERAYQ